MTTSEMCSPATAQMIIWLRVHNIRTLDVTFLGGWPPFVACPCLMSLPMIWRAPPPSHAQTSLSNTWGTLRRHPTLLPPCTRNSHNSLLHYYSAGWCYIAFIYLCTCPRTRCGSLQSISQNRHLLEQSRGTKDHHC